MDLLPCDESVESAKAAAAKEGEGRCLFVSGVLEGRPKTEEGGGKEEEEEGEKIDGDGMDGWTTEEEVLEGRSKTEDGGGTAAGEKSGGGGGGTDGLNIKEQAGGACNRGNGEKKENGVSETSQKQNALDSVFAKSVYGSELTEPSPGGTITTIADGDGAKPPDSFGTREDNVMDEEEYSFASSNDSLDDKESPHQTQSVVEQSFNMQLLRDSIKKGETILSEVLDRDVVFVVGKTGTGKSTLIQGIAGKSFQETSFVTESLSETVESQVFEANDPIPGFEIGHAKSSKTHALNIFCRNESTLGDSVVYIDTPGFEDTEGIEVDIATSLMLTQVCHCEHN